MSIFVGNVTRPCYESSSTPGKALRHSSQATPRAGNGLWKRLLAAAHTQNTHTHTLRTHPATNCCTQPCVYAGAYSVIIYTRAYHTRACGMARPPDAVIAPAKEVKGRFPRSAFVAAELDVLSRESVCVCLMRAIFGRWCFSAVKLRTHIDS